MFQPYLVSTLRVIAIDTKKSKTVDMCIHVFNAIADLTFGDLYGIKCKMSILWGYAAIPNHQKILL